MKAKATSPSSASYEKHSVGFLLVHFGCPASTGFWDTYKFLVEIFDRIHQNNVGFVHAILSRIIFAPMAFVSTLMRYRSISTASGFPLMRHCKQLISSLNAQIGSHSVFLSMQHGDPSIEKVCEDIINHGFQKIIIMPLYPQKIPEMSPSIYTRAHHAIMTSNPAIEDIFVEDFHIDDWYIDPLVQLLREASNGYEHFLFSYHSVPEKNGTVYRQQCQETTTLLMKRSDLNTTWSIGFQSKMGFGTWLQEESSSQVVTLAQKGIKTLLVIAPGFITPCSETMIDIETDLRELFLQNGGQQLDLLPPLCCQESFIVSLSTYLNSYT